jgi:hypothetical protein
VPGESQRLDFLEPQERSEIQMAILAAEQMLVSGIEGRSGNQLLLRGSHC